MSSLMLDGVHIANLPAEMATLLRTMALQRPGEAEDCSWTPRSHEDLSLPAAQNPNVWVLQSSDTMVVDLKIVFRRTTEPVLGWRG